MMRTNCSRVSITSIYGTGQMYVAERCSPSTSVILSVNILIKIVTLMSRRLRQTSGQLVDYLQD